MLANWQTISRELRTNRIELTARRLETPGSAATENLARSLLSQTQSQAYFVRLDHTGDRRGGLT
jgi:hypothetical protein